LKQDPLVRSIYLRNTRFITLDGNRVGMNGSTGVDYAGAWEKISQPNLVQMMLLNYGVVGLMYQEHGWSLLFGGSNAGSIWCSGVPPQGQYGQTEIGFDPAGGNRLRMLVRQEQSECLSQ
jgi:hypothetical protein